MKANEFVKKFGWGEVTKFVGWYGGDTSFKFLKVKEQTISVHSGDQPYDFHIDNLKRLVESHELVESYNGRHCAKNTVGLLQSSMEIGLYHGMDGVDAAVEIPRLKQAIADVESCQ